MDARGQQYIDELIKQPKVLGLVLFGSYARGDNRSDSDVDLLVIVAAGETVKRVETRAGRTYEMKWVTESDALAYWANDRDGCYHVWRDARIIFDRDGTIKRLRAGAEKLIAQGKRGLSDSELAVKRFEIEDQLRAIKWLANDDIAAANHALQRNVANLVEVYFDIEGLWAPPPKKALQLIRKTNPGLGQLLDSFYAPGSTVERSVALTEEIIQTTFGD